MHITKRPAIALWKNLGIRGIGLLLALIVCAIVIYAVTKLNPLEVYVAMFKGTLRLPDKGVVHAEGYRDAAVHSRWSCAGASKCAFGT